jgi:hypothetical protein
MLEGQPSLLASESRVKGRAVLLLHSLPYNKRHACQPLLATVSQLYHESQSYYETQCQRMLTDPCPRLGKTYR